MHRYRKLLVILINILVILWLLKVIYFDTDSDVIGFFVLLTLVFLILYDAYAFLLAYFFFKRNKGILIEVIFILMLVVPFGVLWLFTK